MGVRRRVRRDRPHSLDSPSWTTRGAEREGVDFDAHRPRTERPPSASLDRARRSYCRKMSFGLRAALRCEPRCDALHSPARCTLALHLRGRPPPYSAHGDRAKARRVPPPHGSGGVRSDTTASAAARCRARAVRNLRAECSRRCYTKLARLRLEHAARPLCDSGAAARRAAPRRRSARTPSRAARPRRWQLANGDASPTLPRSVEVQVLSWRRVHHLSGSLRLPSPSLERGGGLRPTRRVGGGERGGRQYFSTSLQLAATSRRGCWRCVPRPIWTRRLRGRRSGKLAAGDIEQLLATRHPNDGAAAVAVRRPSRRRPPPPAAVAYACATARPSS